jgi:DnaK suppressor protein
MPCRSKAEQVRRDARLQRVKAALTRLDDGNYGDCLRCGEGIDNKRLDADPAATLCIACARGD